MKNLYQGDYKRYLLVPAVLFIAFLFLAFVSPGVKPGIDLKGGTNIIVRSDKPLDASAIERALTGKYPLAELQIGSISSPGGYGVFVQFSENSELAQAESLVVQAKQQLSSSPENAKTLALQSIAISSKYAGAENASALQPAQAVGSAETALLNAQESFQLGLQSTISETFGLEGDLRFQKTQIGPSLGENFFGLAINASLAALVLITMVIFLFFREVVPSLAVISAAIFDIAGSLGLMAIFGIPLSLSTIPALLMLIGYSVDTDILLTTRVLKRRDKTVSERAMDSMYTGLTMTFTTIGALIAILTVSYFGQVQVMFEISAVLLFGLFADIISTWMMNAPILLIYAERKGGRA